MEFNDSLISAIDAMETIATITGVICFVIGFGLGLMEQRLTPVIVGILVAANFAYAPDVMRAFAGIEEPSEQVQVLEDGNASEKGDDLEAETDGLLKVLPWLIALPIVFWIFKNVYTDISAQAEAYSEAEKSRNQSLSPPEEIVIPEAQPDPELYTTPKSVGSLKSTRKIQLD